MGRAAARAHINSHGQLITQRIHVCKPVELLANPPLHLFASSVTRLTLLPQHADRDRLRQMPFCQPRPKHRMKMYKLVSQPV